MRIVTVIENTAPAGILCEWGLCLYIEHDGKKYLLDTGMSGRFLENAKRLGIDIGGVDIAVLSHAHYDHAGGMDAFFDANRHARMYISAAAGEDCYKRIAIMRKYIGIPRGTLVRHGHRLVKAGARAQIAPGVWLMAHSAPGLCDIGKRGRLYVKRSGRLLTDDFAHEQSLVFDTGAGLVVLNSCSHAGADNIIGEVRAAFPGAELRAYVGGLHLAHSSDEYVRQYAKRLADMGAPDIYTGHCTGARAVEIMRGVLGDGVKAITTGTVIEL